MLERDLKRRRVGVLGTLVLAHLLSCGDDEESPPPRDPVAGMPVAVAIITPTAALEGESVTLDGTLSSDSAGEALTYSWEQTGGPQATIGDASAASTSLTLPSVDVNRALTLTLTVTNSSGVSNADSVFVTVLDGGIAPVADAGTDQSVNALEEVSLTGSGSSDPDGTIASYLWERESGPAVTITPGAVPSEATFTAPDVTAPSIVLLRLTVTDDAGLRASDTVRIDVEPVPAAVAFTNVPEDPVFLRNTPFDPLTVEVQNAAGDRITDGTGAETEITLAADLGGTLDGPVTLTTSDGAVLLADTSYSAVVSNLTLTASATDLSDGTVSFDVQWPSVFPAAASQFIDVVGVVQVPGIPPETDPPESIPDDVILVTTLNGTADLDLSETTPANVTSDDADLLLVRYQQDGTVVWQRHFDSDGEQQAVAAARTRDGDVAVLFSLSGTIDLAREAPPVELTAEGPRAAALLRVDAVTGDVEWQTRFGGGATVSASDLALASNDDVYVVGSFTGSLNPDPAGATDPVAADGVDAFVVSLSESVLNGSDTDSPALEWFLAPTLADAQELSAVTVAENADVVAGGSQGDPATNAWVYRANAAGTVTSDFTFCGGAAPTQVRDIESRGTSVQVAGLFSGDCDFNGDTTVSNAGGSDGFFAVFTSAGDQLAFVRAVASSADDSVDALIRTDDIDASFVFAGEIGADATFSFGLTPEVLTVPGATAYLLTVGFDGQIKDLVAQPSSRNHRLFSQPDDTVWAASDILVDTSFEADPFDTSVPVTGSIDAQLLQHFDPGAQRLVP